MDGTVRGWDVASGRELWNQPNQSPNRFLALYADRGRSFSADGARVLSLAGNGNVQVLDTATGKEVVRLAGLTPADGAVFVTGGSRVAAWAKNKWVRVWEVQGGKLVTDLDRQADKTRSYDEGDVAVSPDGRLLLTSCRIDPSDSVVRLRDLAVGRILHEFTTKETFFAGGFAFSPDLRLVAAGSFRAWLYLWRLPADPKP